MSVILDALKKLDREKSYHGGGTPDIATKILESDLKRPVKRIRPYFLIVALTVVATLTVTYAVTVRFGFLPGSSVSKPANLFSSNQQAAPALPESGLRIESLPGSATPPAESRQIDSDVALTEPVPDVQKKEAQIHTKTGTVGRKPHMETGAPVESKPSYESKPPIASGGKKKTVVSENLDVSSGSVRKTVEASSHVSPATQPPSLKLSAIVWYEDPSMRFAMINGIKAIEGSEIEGVKVVKIKPTGIRILHEKHYYEISMTR